MTETIKAKVGFFGAVDAVTGSNFLFEVNGKRIMIDCGLFQGDKFSDERNHEKFLIDPSSVDVLLVTHAHIDHIGRIPKFVREGFKGVIYSTPPTEELTQIMLLDTVSILQREATRDGRSPIYVESDVRDTMKLWRTHEYYAPFEVMPQVQCEFKDAGHMLGSSMMFLTVNGTLMVFTGDLGNSPAPLLRDTDSIAGATYLLMESVYGDRNHEGRDERKEILRQAVVDSIGRGGVLLIPAFSIERTQELLFELNELVEHHKLPDVKIYVDSPLAIKATEIYKRSDKYFNQETQHIIKSGDDVFKFPRLFFTETKQESMEIWETKGPKVIMAGSGMLNGGRIIHHLKHYAGDPNNAILLSGYQAAGTPGRRLSEGDKHITVNGEHVSIKAKVSTLHGYSGHKDMDHLVEFAEKGRETLKKVFVTIGEPKSSMFLAQRLRDYVGLNAVVPQPGDIVDLDF
jgi:metallo-beta-lactamase family protein